MGRCARFGSPLATAALCAAVAAAGCNSGTQAAFDSDAFVCFDGNPPAEAIREGSVEIGTAKLELDAEFEPLEEEQELTLWAGSQGGFHFDVLPRLRGLYPGDPKDSRSPKNPHTMLSAYNESGKRLDVHVCARTTAYGRKDGDYHMLRTPLRLIFTGEVGEALYGQRVRIVASVLDIEGRFARDEVWVIAGQDGAE